MQINTLQRCNIFGGSQLALITQMMEASICHGGVRNNMHLCVYLHMTNFFSQMWAKLNLAILALILSVWLKLPVQLSWKLLQWCTAKCTVVLFLCFMLLYVKCTSES